MTYCIIDRRLFAMLRDLTGEHFDIIIQAGQSNSDGTGYGPAENPWIPTENVWYLNFDCTLSLAREAVNGNEIQSNYSLSFAREYMAKGLLAEGRKLLILRTSIGGTGFLDKRWGMTDDLYLHMMEMIRTALALNKENRLVAFLWHQGETDAIFGADFDTHYGNLMGLIRSVREEFQVPQLPFIAGDFVQQWKKDNWNICVPVVDAIRAVCRDCGSGAFVETDGLPSNSQQERIPPMPWEDTIHFSRNALYLLGQRYFAAFDGLRA
jgi:hypothetical protein